MNQQLKRFPAELERRSERRPSNDEFFALARREWAARAIYEAAEAGRRHRIRRRRAIAKMWLRRLMQGIARLQSIRMF